VPTTRIPDTGKNTDEHQRKKTQNIQSLIDTFEGEAIGGMGDSASPPKGNLSRDQRSRGLEAEKKPVPAFLESTSLVPKPQNCSGAQKRATKTGGSVAIAVL